MTLKDLKQKEDDIGDVRYNLGMENLRKEAIKWVKKDFKFIKNVKNDLVQQELIIQEYEWMKRFDITEEDLK